MALATWWLSPLSLQRPQACRGLHSLGPVLIGPELSRPPLRQGYFWSDYQPLSLHVCQELGRLGATDSRRLSGPGDSLGW